VKIFAKSKWQAIIRAMPSATLFGLAIATCGMIWDGWVLPYLQDVAFGTYLPTTERAIEKFVVMGTFGALIGLLSRIKRSSPHEVDRAL
jgi:hypothetical protein